MSRKKKREEKQQYGHFKRHLMRENVVETKKNLKRETESLLIAAQNNALRTN